MNEVIHVSKKNKLNFTTCKYNHIWVYLSLLTLDEKGNILLDTDEEEKQRIFMFDTGAQHTLISKMRAEKLGYLYCEHKGKTRVSVGGSILWCSKIEIPDIIITNDIIVHKPIILIPDDYDYNKNILGQDILQLFNYYMDNFSHNIYFDKEKYGV